MLKFRDVFGRYEEASLSQLEAAELLRVDERTFRRWCRRYEEEGEAGLLDRRLGKSSPKRVPAAEAETLYQERHLGFTAKHFHEHAVRNHGLRWGYSWTNTYLQERGYLKKGSPPWGTPAQASSQAIARHDAAPGWLAALLAPGSRTCPGSDCYARRCDRRDAKRSQAKWLRRLGFLIFSCLPPALLSAALLFASQHEAPFLGLGWRDSLPLAMRRWGHLTD